MTERKRSVEIVMISIFIFLFPLIANLVINTISWSCIGSSLWTWKEFIRSNWFTFIFFGILAIGIFKLNNKIRLITLALTIAMSISGPTGLIIGFFKVGLKVHIEIIKKIGLLAVIFPWMLLIPVSLLCGGIAFYLTRPKVKEQFK
jgi:hypothetical protein